MISALCQDGTLQACSRPRLPPKYLPRRISLPVFIGSTFAAEVVGVNGDLPTNDSPTNDTVQLIGGGRHDRADWCDIQIG